VVASGSGKLNGGGSDESTTAGQPSLVTLAARTFRQASTLATAVLSNSPLKVFQSLGAFEIKVRRRETPSYSVYIIRTFALADGPTFGQLLHAFTRLMSRSMEPFRFRVASLGCRDFMCVVLQRLPAFPLIFFSLRLLR
jgi:hypothetical protein